jgi:hypothetical protein
MKATAVRLAGGETALVDAGDLSLLEGHRWRTMRSRWTVYASASSHGHTLLMHRVILGLTKGDGKCCDHINRNGLDNRRCNLRIATPTQNNANHEIHRAAKRNSRFKGVFRSLDCWWAGLKSEGVLHYLGRYSDEVEAALAYDRAARHHFGAFARLNFPQPGECGCVVEEISGRFARGVAA